MTKDDISYLFLALLHILLGVVIYLFPALSKLYTAVILAGGLLFVVIRQNRNHEVLLVCAYIVGSEAFLRMTGGNPIYEFSKYAIIIFMLVGMYYQGFSSRAVPYWIFLLLLVPGLVLATQTFHLERSMRKIISFNISGELALGIAALYCYSRQISFKRLNTLLLWMVLPIVSMVIYLILYTPNVREVITSTNSNFETSAGYGPNQVATILGLGMFIMFSRILFTTKANIVLLVNLALGLIITYRGLVTFSRGGMITGFAMLVVLFVFTYIRASGTGKTKLNYIFIPLVVALIGIWSYSSLQTGGLIEKRYSNEDALGREKKDQFTGREFIATTEIEYFLQNPIFGVGVAQGAEIRKEQTGELIVSHNEITRMMAEHGMLGIIALLILLITPLALYLENKGHLYLVAFIVFWLLTINHTAIRMAAPAFVYALSLLKVVPNEENIVHRK